ncbi:hypothetical protein WG66_004006 [Moniliophthora roreri]|nr:hypothetical protein WG66_004006 [Moniliophthora roreri]
MPELRTGTVGPVVIADVVTIKKPKLEHSKFGEFEFVKRGDIINAKDLHPEDWDWIWRNGEIFGRHKVRRMICTIELHPDRHPKFIAVMYEGEEAFESWEEDFERFCGKAKFTIYSRSLKAVTRRPQEAGMLSDWVVKPGSAGIMDMTLVDVVNPREFVFRLHSNGQDSGKGGYRHPYGYSMQSRTRETKKAIFIADPQRCNELPADSSNLHTSDIPEVTPPIYLFLESPPDWYRGQKDTVVCTSGLTTRPADQRFPKANTGDYVFLCSLRLLYPALLSCVHGRLPLTPPFNTEFEIIGPETEYGRFEEVTERRELAKTASWWEAIAGSDISVFGL